MSMLAFVALGAAITSPNDEIHDWLVTLSTTAQSLIGCAYENFFENFFSSWKSRLMKQSETEMLSSHDQDSLNQALKEIPDLFNVTELN